MTILMDDGEGHRCDATCYNAKGGDCDCICGGAHHALGLEAAAEAAGVTLLGVRFTTKDKRLRSFGFVTDPTDEFESVKSMLKSWGATRVWLEASEDFEEGDDE